MRVAAQVAPLYPDLNLDLLVAGILFHDSGKLWENHLPETGFSMPFDERGEMIGHIALGMDLVTSLWRKIQADPEQAAAWEKLSPSLEDIRLHLLHLVAAHHGEMQFGSPVIPKTPEAMTLHYIEHLDARTEVFIAGYRGGRPVGSVPAPGCGHGGPPRRSQRAGDWPSASWFVSSTGRPRRAVASLSS